MTSYHDILRNYIGRTDCAAYALELHQAGFSDKVFNILKNTPKNTVAYSILVDKLCSAHREARTDHQGFPIGTYVTISYNGHIVEQYMNYALIQY